MKFGLFLALLVLLASTNVHGRKKARTDDNKLRPVRPTTDVETGTDQVPSDSKNRESDDVTVDKPVLTKQEDRRMKSTPGKSEVTNKSQEPVEEQEKTKPVTVEISNKQVDRDGPTQERTKTGTTVHDETKPVTIEITNKKGDHDGPTNERTKTVITVEQETKTETTEVVTTPVNNVQVEHPDYKSTVETPKAKEEVHDKKPDEAGKSNQHFDEVVTEKNHVGHGSINEGQTQKITSESAPLRMTENFVHISGRIVLVKYSSSSVGSVQYDLDGRRFVNDIRPSPDYRPFIYDLLARQSLVTLYVSTQKTIDRKLAFAQFPIKVEREHFPLSFDINVELPNQLRGLLERADITLYFFVYITNLDTRMDTYLPAGTSQILLQGTNRLVQKLDVYVKSSGIEVVGLFRGRFGQRFIYPGTSFQVFIVPEQSLTLLHTEKFESVGQLTINTVPALYPIPFSILVQHQLLKPNIKYYAIGYIFEKGFRRLIHQEPTLVINEQKSLVTTQVLFNVIPSPFILRGFVTPSMPGSFILQKNSTLILRIHQIGSDTSDIIYRLPNIITFPQIFQINISQALNFDPSKNYDIRALITDEKNNIYMANLQPIPLTDDFTKLTIPVDALLYYVQVRLHSPSNQLLSYIPGSSAQIFLTDTPETPTKPIVAVRIDSITPDFHDFSIQIPATAIVRGRNYYLVMMIEINGIITHVSKTLLISNNQPPPLVIQLPVLSLSLLSGVIFDIENRPAQWSSSSYANLYLLDDQVDNIDKGVIQVWKIHVENDFPVRFEVHLDFNRLRSDRVYRLQAAIENGRNLLEYKPAGSVLIFKPAIGLIPDVRIPVRTVKTHQLINGLISMTDIQGPLPEKSEIIVQLSSSPSLLRPVIIEEIRIKTDGRQLPIEFSMNLPLNKIDITSVYYFLVQYVVRDTVIIPVSQTFAFSPRNEATVLLTISKTRQIQITGQVTSTGRPLVLPDGAKLHLYITDSIDTVKSLIISEAYLQSSLNSLYSFTMNIDSVILQKKIPLYLRADILYDNGIILSIPRPVLLQITPGGEWNINLVIDLPTLLIGEIVSMSQHEATSGELEVYVEILEFGTKNIVHTARLRLEANFPQKFRIELDNELFVRFPKLQARALIKNCKDQILFEAGGVVNIHAGLNIKLVLPVRLTDPEKFKELRPSINEIAPLKTGRWSLSVTGTVTGTIINSIIGTNPNVVAHAGDEHGH